MLSHTCRGLIGNPTRQCPQEQPGPCQPPHPGRSAQLTLHLLFTAPPPPATGELLEVAISCGAEAQAAAVDLILGKGCVKPLGPEDDAVLK